MGQRRRLCEADWQYIYEQKMAGKTCAQIAGELACSRACVRKWWRRSRSHGYVRVRPKALGRPAAGPLASFPLELRQHVVALKQAQPRWGGRRILAELRTQAVAATVLPSASQITRYLKVTCPDLVRAPQRLPPPARLTFSQATFPHQVWQLDFKEKIVLQDGTIATIATLRDEFSGAILMACAFDVTRGTHYRKLNLAEICHTVRLAFTAWGTLPEILQTDNEVLLAGGVQRDFPSVFTLWLCGLGVRHVRIRPKRPTDQAEVERTHRTLADFTSAATTRVNLTTLQQALDHEVQTYNLHFPSRAKQCQGQPPLVACPALQDPRTHYQLSLEPLLFDLQRIARHLHQTPFPRKVNTGGQVSIGDHLYYIGSRFAERHVTVHFNPATLQWHFCDSSTDELLAARTAVNLDYLTLTGYPLADAAVQSADYFQLPLLVTWPEPPS